MFDKRTIGRMRRGYGIGVSKTKLAQAMVEILVQLPEGSKNLKDTVVANLGLLGMFSATRDINEVWTVSKKRAARDHPDRFVLDGRKVLHWREQSSPVLDKKISAANFKKLNGLAEEEGCSVNALVSRMIKVYTKRNRMAGDTP